MKKFIKELRKYWEYAVYAAKCDLKAEVANSYLNGLWWILEPLCSMLVYTIIFSIVFPQNELHFPLFVFIGVTMWDFFCRSITSSIDIVRCNQHIISKVFIPKHILLVQRMIVLWFKMLICEVLIVIMMLVMNISVGIYFLWIIPLLALFRFFCFACGLNLLHFGVYISDLSNVINIVLNILFYITGIFYNVEKCFPDKVGYFFQRINPIAYFIFCVRKVVIYNQNISIIMFVILFIVSLGLTINGLRLIRKYENSYVKVI